jgi:hypothetical protein
MSSAAADERWGAQAFLLTQPLLGGLGFGEALTAFFPLIGCEELRTHFNEARDHLEDGDAAPGAAIALAETFLIQAADNDGIGEILREEFHDLHEDFVLERVGFEALAVVRDAEAVGDVFVEAALGRGFSVGEFATPFNGDHLPAGCGSLADDVGTERSRDYVFDSLEICHDRPPCMELAVEMAAIL